MDEWIGLVLDAGCKALSGFGPDASVSYADCTAAIPPEEGAKTLEEIVRTLDPADPNDGYLCEHRVVHADGRMLRLASAGRAAFEPDPAAAAGLCAVRIMGTV